MQSHSRLHQNIQLWLGVNRFQRKVRMAAKWGCGYRVAHTWLLLSSSVVFTERIHCSYSSLRPAPAHSRTLVVLILYNIYLQLGVWLSTQLRCCLLYTVRHTTVLLHTGAALRMLYEQMMLSHSGLYSGSMAHGGPSFAAGLLYLLLVLLFSTTRYRNNSQPTVAVHLTFCCTVSVVHARTPCYARSQLPLWLQA
jgi:hypothetical protein